jgi:flagellar basal-body rod protein FlgB
MKLFDATTTLLEKSLDARLERQNVLAGNLANANTPGYVPKDIDFEATLTKSMSAVEMGGTPTVGPSVPNPGFMPVEAGGISVNTAGQIDLSTSTTMRTDRSTAAGIDGNKVDSDKAMVNLAENAMQYGASARAVGTKLAILKYVANDGNG